MNNQTAGRARRSQATGAWFSTDQPHKIGNVGNWLVGVSGIGEAVIMFLLWLIYAATSFVARYIFRKEPLRTEWDDYQGFVYCQIQNTNVRFFTTINGTTRNVVKPPAITRPISTITRFNTVNSTPPRVAFTFADGFHIELHISDKDATFTNFRTTLNSMVT